MHLLNVPSSLYLVRGGLWFLDQHRAAEQVAACAEYIQTHMLEATSMPTESMLDTLADALTSLEYYLEGGVLLHAKENRSVLDLTDESLKALGFAGVNASAEETVFDWQQGMPSVAEPAGLAVVHYKMRFLGDPRGVLLPRQWLHEQLAAHILFEQGIGHLNGEAVFVLELDEALEWPDLQWHSMRHFMLEGRCRCFAC